MKAARVERSATIDRPRLAWGDLGLILMGGLALLGLVLFGHLYPEYAIWAAPPRVLLGILYVLFVPGYLLQVVLFPHQKDLDNIERLGLSLGLSVALAPLLALLLDHLPWGLHFWPIILGQALLVLLLAGAALLRRMTLPRAEVYAPDLRLRPRDRWRDLSRPERRLYLLAFAALLFAGLVVAWVFLVPSPDKFMTEFYMLGKEGLAEDFPRQAQVGEPLQVTLGIDNRERGPMRYRIEIWAVDQLDGRRQQVGGFLPLALERGQKIEFPAVWRMPWAGPDQQVEFYLYQGDGGKPYRTLRLWLDVAAPK